LVKKAEAARSVEAEMAVAEAPAMFAAPLVPLRRAVPEHDASGDPFLQCGARSTKCLKDDYIFPLMGDSTCDKGWVEHGLREPKHGCSRGDRRWKNHNCERHSLCGLLIWDPLVQPWTFCQYAANPLKPSWRTASRDHKRDLVEAGRQLTRILRHSGPKPRGNRGEWLGSDSGGWILIKDFLLNVPRLGPFDGLSWNTASLDLLLNIISLEGATKKGRYHVSVEVWRGGHACESGIIPSSDSHVAAIKANNPSDFEKIGKNYALFAMRSVAGHSDGYPNLDNERIGCKASLDSLTNGASGIFHMSRRSAVLSICQKGIQAGFGGSRNHAYFGPYMISDKRNVSGGRGKSAGTDDAFAGCCFSIDRKAFFEKGPWWTSSGMMLLDPDSVVTIKDFEQIWVHANDNLRTAPELLYDPSRIGESISSFVPGRLERQNAVVCELARVILHEGGMPSVGDYAASDPSDKVAISAWGIVSKRFLISETDLYPDNVVLIRCPACMLAHPSGFVSCTFCFAAWLFERDVAPAVGVTPLIIPQAVEALTGREVTILARASAYGMRGFHTRSDAGVFWKEVSKAMKWQLRWLGSEPMSDVFRTTAAVKGMSPRCDGTGLHDGTWVPSGPGDLGPDARAILIYKNPADLMQYLNKIQIHQMSEFLLGLPHRVEKTELERCKKSHTWKRISEDWFEACFGIRYPFSDPGEVGVTIRSSYVKSISPAWAIAARAMDQVAALLRPAVGTFRHVSAMPAAASETDELPVYDRDDNPNTGGASSSAGPASAWPGGGDSAGGCGAGVGKGKPPFGGGPELQGMSAHYAAQLGSGKGAPSTPPVGPSKGTGKPWGGVTPKMQGKGKGYGWQNWTDYPVPATTPTWNAGYARRERSWQAAAWWTAGAATWAPWGSQGYEIVALQVEKAATCASMPGRNSDGYEFASWWLLYLVIASLVLNVIFCLGFIFFLLKRNVVPMVSNVQVPAAASADERAPLPVVGVTSLAPVSASGSSAAFDITNYDVRSDLYETNGQRRAADAFEGGYDEMMQRHIAAAMRLENTGLYYCTPCGDKYHLKNCCPTYENMQIIELSPCEYCVGRPMAIFQGSVLQKWYANTMIYGARYYHADRECRAHGSLTLHVKIMCRTCEQAQNVRLRHHYLRIRAENA
jgi:hypothetical protein